MAYIVK